VIDPADRQVKALEANRDVAKQLVTIDAALLTFGITYVSKTGTAWQWLIGATVILLLISITVGVFALFQNVSETHSTAGNINDTYLRGALIACLAAFVMAICCLSFYVLLVPTSGSSNPPAKPAPTSSPTPGK